MEVRKVKGAENPADLFTKPPEPRQSSYIGATFWMRVPGRAASAPLLRRMEGQQVNGIGTRELLPHQKSQAEIDEVYPRMIAPAEYGDQDVDVVSQAELWVVHV